MIYINIDEWKTSYDWKYAQLRIAVLNKSNKADTGVVHDYWLAHYLRLSKLCDKMDRKSHDSRI